MAGLSESSYLPTGRSRGERDELADTDVERGKGAVEAILAALDGAWAADPAQLRGTCTRPEKNQKLHVNVGLVFSALSHRRMVLSCLRARRCQLNELSPTGSARDSP